MTLLSPAPDLETCVQFWQRQLSLQGWRVAVKVVSRADLKDGTVGDIEADAGTRVATIRVLRETDYDLRRSQARADQRLTIAHEMVHLSRLNAGDQTWREEQGTIETTNLLLRRHGRWRELSVAEF